MLETRVEHLTERIDIIQEDVIDSKKALHNISSDIHIMSQTSVKMEQALAKLLETETKFQLHAQRTELNHESHDRLFKDIFTRIEILEEHDSEFHQILYQSCDIKSKEIDEKTNKILEQANELTNQNFTYTLYLIGVMFSLFLGYMAYVDSQNSALADKISIRESVSVQNGTHIMTVKSELKDLHADIKDLRSDLMMMLKK